MKQKMTALLVVLLLVFGALAFLRIPLRRGYLGPVALSIQSYQTNTTGQVSALIRVVNEGRHTVDIGFGTETLESNLWVDATSGRSDYHHMTMVRDHLPPGGDQVVSVGVPKLGSTWRALVMCQKRFPNDWKKPLHWIFEGYLLKRGIVEHFYSEEI
jgi:hypothetical protein